MEERRKHERAHMSSEAKVHRMDGAYVDAVLLDISRYGTCLRASVPLKDSEHITVKIILNRDDDTFSSEEVPSTVRWVERSDDVFTAGVSFDKKINERDFPNFSRCLEFTMPRR